jgi:GDPmannose 4,6-dehydratase
MSNMSSKRDWGHARGYVEMQWLMLQQEEPRDFVIATGQQTSVRDFIVRAAQRLGIEMKFAGAELEEIGRVVAIDTSVADPKITLKPGDVIVRIDERYYRPAEVEALLGDPSKARDSLGWQPTTTLDEMISEMMEKDLESARKDRLLINEGYEVPQPVE